ncbi:folylpolyglutamate synthase/dihydrofolate synthase family protein [Clostridium sp. JN-1]|uniref:bifunctional folylpolyglutamate synthase/dihydrofolate synthase n=1 Tax=Clostridium sp. JN-1 TaxID=2483110 RepID=UPI000F0B0012|nr:folylpolyglutamate synthase/dihydrofolate synthase family protein [Clostridium sp. JN-1]
MNYDEAVEYIVNTARFGKKSGLNRIKKILELLDNPHEKIKFIHIAGTNGKGSTTAMISSILINAGFKVGMFTSPYIEKFEERIQINGQNISKSALSEIVTDISKAVNKVIEMGYGNPTQFEIITCAMFCYFYYENVDFGVIEVGIGGRLDCTNVIKPYDDKSKGGVILSVITSISFDHMALLGDTLQEIAYEKAGIIKTGIPVVLYPNEMEVENAVEKVCLDKNAKLIKVPFNCVRSINHEKINSKSIDFNQKLEVKTSKDKYEIELSLLGKHQLFNCAASIFAIEELIKMGVKIEKRHIYDSLKKVKWMGRLEVMRNNPIVVIDGAHNADGIQKLKESIEEYFDYKKLILILGILADKEVSKMVQEIAPMAQKIITVSPNTYRAESSEELCEIVKKVNSNSESKSDYKDAYETALSYCNKDDLLVISGSLYMIGDMRKIINKSHRMYNS